VRRYRIRFTPEAEEDLLRLYDFLLEKDIGAAERALEAIREAARLLQFSPFSCRKVLRDDPFLRELVIPFGSAGYVALYEIEGKRIVTVLAVRHQREEDYH
jgi:plasmid stabilization system protein ParE